MTPTSPAPVLPEPHAAGGDRGRGPRRGLLLVILTLTMLVVAGFVGWRLVAGRALDRVEVEVTSYDCRGDGTAVRSNPRATTVETAAEMRCTFTVRVANHSQRTVHLGNVRALAMGPETGALIRAESIDGRTPRGDRLSTDALYGLDRAVPAGDSAAFDIVALFNPAACDDSRRVRLFHFPRVQVSALGVDRAVDGSKALAFHNTARTPGCDDL